MKDAKKEKTDFECSRLPAVDVTAVLGYGAGHYERSKKGVARATERRGGTEAPFPNTRHVLNLHGLHEIRDNGRPGYGQGFPGGDKTAHTGANGGIRTCPD